MRKIYFVLASALFLASCSDREDKLEEKYAPFDHFFFQRSFPESSLDFEEMHRSLEKSRNFYAFRSSKSSEAEWQQEGPFNIGGRINVVAIHPENPSIWITGTAGGGAYITEDEGETWENLTEELTHLPVGDIVFDPNDPETIYLGTGDVNISGNVYVGNGLYRSTDGGESWENIGLESSRIISKIIVNPQNSDQIFVSTMGVPFETGPDRGLYRSNDGGATWEQILFINETAGVIDLVMNPDDPSVLYAAGWNRVRTNFESIASGDDAKIFKTSDGGDTWIELSEGLPEGPMSRIGLHLWEGDPEVLFALYVNPEFQLEGVYKSLDAGNSFDEVPTDGIPENLLGGFGWFFGKIGVNPTDQDEVSVLGVNLYTTFNGGFTWQMSAPDWSLYEVHADKHDMEYLGPDDILLATDGGLYRTTNGFASWSDVDYIPNTQFYRIATSPYDTTVFYGGAQDNGTSVTDTILGDGNWIRFFGGDGFTPIPDPVNEEVTYAMTQNGRYWYINWETFDIFELSGGYPIDERVNWDAPFIMDHDDNTTLFMGRERVYKMEDAPFGFWEPISESLVEDSDLFFSRRNISTVNQSQLSGDILYAGTSDGKVWSTQNGGNDWTDISEGLPGYYVTDVKASPFNEEVVLVSVSGYRNNDETPHLYLSSDYGADWVPVTGDLVEMPVNHIEIYDETTWFIATDNGVYVTENSGINWNRVGENFPYVVVTDIEIQEETNQLVAGTYGVSLFTIDIEGVLEGTVTVTDNREGHDLKIYPNPTTDYLLVDGTASDTRYSIFDLSGKLIGQGQISQGRISLSAPAGTYVLKLAQGNSTIRTEKFVITDF